MQKCCGTYVPQHFLYLLTIRSLNIVLNKDKKKLNRKKQHKQQIKQIERTVKDELLQSSDFYFASRFFSSF